MPVVLTEDLDKLTQAKADDIRSALGNPFTSKTPTSSDSLTNPLGGGNGTASISPDASLPAPDAPPKLDGGNGLPAPNAPLDAAMAWGQSQLGKPYMWGSSGGRSDLSGNAPGFDCSGFVAQFYNKLGLSVPAQTASAYAATKPLSEDAARPGDIVEFNMNSNDPHEQHIAIYLGNGKVLQSGGTQSNVNIGDINQFGQGTYQFRRADGFDKISQNTEATTTLGGTAKTVAPPPVTDPTGQVVSAKSGGLDAFKSSFAPYAQYAAQKLNIDPGTVTAMAISESGGGNVPGNSFFGMKGGGTGTTSEPTWELVNGQRVQTNANFATFDSPKAAVDAWVSYIQKNAPKAVGAQTPEDFASGLKAGGYMTDTADHYAQTLRALGAGTGGVSTGAPPDTTSLAAPSATSTPSSAPNLLDQATAFKNSLGNPFESALDSAGSAKDNLLSQASAFKDALGSPFHDQNAGVMTASQQPTPSDSLTNPIMQANPTTPPIGSLTPPTPEPTVLDNIGGAVADNQANPPLKPLGDAIANSGANQLRHDVFPNITEPGHPMNTPTTGSLTPEDSSLSLPMAFMGTGDVQAARDALPGLRVAVDALRSQFPQMSEGSLAASGAAKALAAAEKTIAEAPPEVPKTNGYASYPAPPAKPTTPEPAPQATTDVMQGMLDMLRKQGVHDPAQIDALQAQIDALKPPAPTVTEPATPVERITKPVADEPPIRTYDAEGNQLTGPVDNTPPERYDPEAGKWVPDNSGNKTIDTYGKIAAGDHQIGSKAGPSAPYDKADAQVPGLHYDQATKGWVDGEGNPVDLTALGGAKPSKAASKGAPEPTPSKVISENTGRGEPTTPAPDPELYGTHGATPETVQAAHERINYSTGNQMAEHAALDDMLRKGANPAEVARFLAQVEGKSVGATDMLRTLRTGSMAGGDTTEAKVLLSPLIQTAMRAPVGAIKAIVKGKPSDVPKGMMGGIEGLADGTLDALQQLKYGINMRTALAGSAGGGFGHAPGIDVLGKNTAQRAAGTLALGLVRTHGAAADISAGIGRGAAKATGATAAEATEAGQKWALRSGEYGTVGRAFSNAIQEVKNVNPVLDVVGQILVPFYRVGYNATVQEIERSPVGIIGTAADVARGKLPASAPSWLKGPYAEGANGKAVTPVGDRLANNMFGVGLAAIGFSNAANGNLTGEHPAGNDPKWSVRVGGQWLPLRFLVGGGEALAQSAILYEAARDGNGNVGRMAELSAAAYVAHVHDETWLRSVGDLLEMVGNDARNIGTSRDAQAKNDLGFKLGALAKSFEPQGTLIGQMATHIKDATNPDDGTSSSGGRASRPSRPTRPSRPSR